MILVDTSVWVEHLNRGDAQLAARLEQGDVLCHPFVVGEVALGTLGRRALVLDLLSSLPQAVVAADAEVLSFIETQQLYGRGIGWVDSHLLAAARLTPNATLWTRDRRLRATAERLSLATP